MFNTDSRQWAAHLFGKAELGDPRRTKRLVKLAGDMAKQTGSSVVKASGDPASIEGAYRFIRNETIKVQDIAQAGYLQTDRLVEQSALVLAIQDTTGLSYRHSVCDDLGTVNSAGADSKNPKGRTLYAHSTIMLDAESEQVLGLSNQYYWYRESKREVGSHQHPSRQQEDKESYKWQRNSEALSQRMGSMDNVLDVCDREADMYDYLNYQLSQGHRFIVRAKDSRTLKQPKAKLVDVLATIDADSHFIIDIKQKGGRRARQATMALSYSTVILKRPKRAKGKSEITVNMVVCQEVVKDGSYEKLCWILYTTEVINSVDDARKIVRYYELRWRIEEFHKVWKSDGTQVEGLRMQSRENIMRIAVIQAFIAIRLLQLQGLAQNQEQAKEISCTGNFSQLSWKILWKKIEKNKPLPKDAPSLHWAYYAMAKLGGWYDSRCTGRVGVKALWLGWQRLMALVESVEIIKELDLELNL